MRDLDHGAEARGEQLVEGRARRRHLDPRRRIRVVGEFEDVADEGERCSRCRRSTAIFFFFSSATVLIFLPPGADQQHHVVFEDRDRAGAGRHLGVGAQHREIGFLAVELRQRLGVVAVGDDLELQPRGIVLQHGREPGGEARLGAIGFADGKHQRLGIAQPDPAAPHHGGGQDQGQEENSKICVRLLLTTRKRRRGISGCGVGASALMARTRGQGRVGRRTGAAGRPNEFVNT